MPRAIGMGSHLIFVFLRAELSRDRKDSFLWKFCWSNAGREEVKVREGTVRRAWRYVGGGNRERVGARMSWREQDDAISTSLPRSQCNQSLGLGFGGSSSSHSGSMTVRRRVGNAELLEPMT
jgi:hypothetical protein